MVMTPGGKQKKRSLSHSPDGGLSGKKKKLSQGGGAVQTPPAKPKQTDVNLFKQINSKKSPVAQMTPGKKQLEKKQKNKPNKAALISQKEDSDSDDDEDDDEDDEDDDDDSSDENNVANKSLQNKNKNVNASVIKTDNANDDDEDDDDDEEDDDEEDDDDDDDDEEDDDEDDENQVTLNKQQPKGNQINSQKKETGNVNKPLLGEHANEEESSDDDDDDDDDDDEEEDDDSSDNDDTPGQKVPPKKPKLDGAQQEASPSQKQRFAMFVTNISSRCDKQKLKELFEKVVPVKDINILPNRGDKWAAVVVLNNEEDQKKSLSLHQNMVEGKRICIVYSDQTRNNEGGGGGGGFRGRGGRGFGGGRGGSPGRGGFRGGRGGQGDFRGGRGGQRDFRGGGGRGGQGGFRGGRGGQGGFPKGDKSPGEKRTFGDMRNSGQGVNTKKTFGDD